MAINENRLWELLRQDADDLRCEDFIKDCINDSREEVDALIGRLQGIACNHARSYVGFMAMQVVSCLSRQEYGVSPQMIYRSFDILLDAMNRPDYFGSQHLALSLMGGLIREISDKDRISKFEMAVKKIALESQSPATRSLASIFLESK